MIRNFRVGDEREVMMGFDFGFVGVASTVVVVVAVEGIGLVGWKEEGRKPMEGCGVMNETSAEMCG